MTENTEYTWTYVDSTDQCTVTVTGQGDWYGTKTATVARKDSGTNPVVFTKHNPLDTTNLVVTLAKRGTPPDVALQVKTAEDSAWHDMQYDT